MTENPHVYFANIQGLKSRYVKAKERVKRKHHHPIVETWLRACNACLVLADKSVEELREETNLPEKIREGHVNMANEMSEVADLLLGLIEGGIPNHDALLQALEIDISDD